MKIAGLLAGLLFLISFAAQADINSVSSFDFAREINISKVIEKAHAQDINIVPVATDKYGYDYSNEPDSIDDAARMLEYKIREMGIPARVIVHESEPPFIKATIVGVVNSYQYKNILKLFSRENGEMFYFGYKVSIGASVIEDDSNEPDNIDDAARKLAYKIRAMGILSTVIIHESEPPFIKATIGPLTGEQYKNMLDLFNHEDGDLYYYGYKVQLSVLA